MDKYTINKRLGSGSFGVVWQATNEATGEIVAVKNLRRKIKTPEECHNLREIKSLRKLKHPNIMKLEEVVIEEDNLFLVFEYLEQNLLEVMNDRSTPFSESELGNLLFQVFAGLAHMHKEGYFHRDLKPENLLVSKDVIKIADLGSAREITSQPPYTEYVSTRWYRAPEVLLRSQKYDRAVDMWAMGAIMAELFTFRPIFLGINEPDQMYKICSVLGTPTKSNWAGGLELADTIHYEFPQLSGAHLWDLIPSASYEAINLIHLLCSWDPLKRPTAAQCLDHPFFKSCRHVPRNTLMETEAVKLEDQYLMTTSSGTTTGSEGDRSHESVTTDLLQRLENNIFDAFNNEYSQIGGLRW